MENKQVADPLAWTKKADFLCNYSWKGKARKQIIEEMHLPDFEQEKLDEAMAALAPLGKFTGMDLDRYILHLFDLEEDDIEIDEDDFRK